MGDTTIQKDYKLFVLNKDAVDANARLRCNAVDTCFKKVEVFAKCDVVDFYLSRGEVVPIYGERGQNISSTNGIVAVGVRIPGVDLY